MSAPDDWNTKIIEEFRANAAASAGTSKAPQWCWYITPAARAVGRPSHP